VSGEAERDVIFEMVRLGDTQRVAAIDVDSGVEVVVIAPANAALADVRALALKKLERALAGDNGAAGPIAPGAGKLV
jgi:hypothetical protein